MLEPVPHKFKKNIMFFLLKSIAFEVINVLNVVIPHKKWLAGTIN